MPRDVLINAGAGEVRVAVMEDGVLDQLWLERTLGFEEVPGRKRERSAAASRSIVGDIILGRVQRVLPAMQAAFVNVGLDRAGFLAAREARRRGYAVVHFDCRGTEGYGRSLEEAGDHQFTTGLPGDIAAGVRWLAAQGMIDPNSDVQSRSESSTDAALASVNRCRAIFSPTFRRDRWIQPSDARIEADYLH